MSETWRPVVGWEGLYEVSDLGRVRSLDRIVEMNSRWGGTIKRLHPGRVLKLQKCSVAPDFPRGYWEVQLARDGNAQHARVHVLVLTAFVGPKPEGMEARHLNGNPHDSRAANLMWGSKKDNQTDKERHGTVLRGDKAPWTKLTASRLAQARFLLGHGRLLKDVASRLGVHEKTLSYRLARDATCQM